MATAIIDGISARYEVVGSWPPILMYAPGGFDATVEKWSALGVYARIKRLDHLSKKDLLRLDIPALIVPGQDAAHATSAARYFEECLPRSQYWDVPVAGQTEEPTSARLLEFLDQASAASG